MTVIKCQITGCKNIANKYCMEAEELFVCSEHIKNWCSPHGHEFINLTEGVHRQIKSLTQSIILRKKSVEISLEIIKADKIRIRHYKGWLKLNGK